MNFSTFLKNEIKHLHLLNHPFYQAWNEGHLQKTTLQKYAQQYYHHVIDFPRYISATHSNCSDLAKRRLLLENLIDEEGLNQTPHPELWMNFAKGLGLTEAQVKLSSPMHSINKVRNTFMKYGKRSYIEGLSSLYAYEYQIPEIAETKINGLVEKFGITQNSALEFFKVHKKADIHHREACEKLLNEFNSTEQSLAVNSSLESAQSLWDFLTEMMEYDRAA